MSEWDIPVRHSCRWLGYIQRVLMKAVYSSLVSRGSGMSLRNSFNKAATSWTLCSSSRETSTPRSNSSRSWKDNGSSGSLRTAHLNIQCPAKEGLWHAASRSRFTQTPPRPQEGEANNVWPWSTESMQTQPWMNEVKVLVSLYSHQGSRYKPIYMCIYL